MFKYISDILSKFSPKQRIIALVILVVSIFTITYGGKIIDGFTETDKRLVNEINSLRNVNRELFIQNDTLQRIILDNQLQCSEDIAEVRRRILEDLGILERQIMLTQHRSLMKTGSSSSSDTVMMMSPTPINDNTSTTMMLEGIRQMKEKIKN